MSVKIIVTVRISDIRVLFGREFKSQPSKNETMTKTVESTWQEGKQSNRLEQPSLLSTIVTEQSAESRLETQIEKRSP